MTMQTAGDHSASIPLPVPDIGCNISPVTAAATAASVVVAPELSGSDSSVESNFTIGMF
uniref:Uncharacterized protein n=1 Tax=Setaria digitata TaxID=48799 RepID=A0A915PJR1_9BILA